MGTRVEVESEVVRSEETNKKSGFTLAPLGVRGNQRGCVHDWGSIR
jgi:hypothetical protein